MKLKGKRKLWFKTYDFQNPGSTRIWITLDNYKISIFK